MISSAAAPACRPVFARVLCQSISGANCSQPSQNGYRFPVLDIDSYFDAVEAVPVRFRRAAGTSVTGLTSGGAGG